MKPKRQYHKTSKFYDRAKNMRMEERNRKICADYGSGKKSMEQIAIDNGISIARVSYIWNKYAIEYSNISCCGVEMGEDGICPICKEHCK